jgi:peptidoglycan/xylan/chitin deacetylase (PgdA/CDA1 family)
MYHRVADLACDPWELAVTPERFEEQIAFLAKHRAAIDLADLDQSGAYTSNGSKLAVTFDDGYSDNLTHALPILERYNIPATLFVIAGTLDRKREFWWDALTRAVFSPNALPARIELPLGKATRSFVLEGNGNILPADMGWNANEDAPSTPRQRLYLALWEAIVVLSQEQQDAAIDTLLEMAGEPLAGAKESHPASTDAIAAVASHPLLTIGSHTYDHVSLTDLSPSSQRAQIERGHRRIEEIVGHHVDRFSYPFGRMDRTAQRHIADLGLRYVCTSRQNVARPWSSRRLLPRLQVPNLGGQEFASWLRDDYVLLTNVEADV